MKIILVSNPNLEEAGRPTTHVPLGLLSLATVLSRQGMEVEIVDINGLGDDPQFRRVPEILMSMAPDVLGFTTWCDSYLVLLRLARRCKDLAPAVPIIFGGPQASQTARQTVENFPQVDLVIRGEGEQTIGEVAAALPSRQKLRHLPGLTFKDGGRTIHTRLLEPLKDLDTLPLPDYRLFPAVKRLRRVPIEVGRGCPYHCTFCCTGNFLGGVRLRSPRQVVRLIWNIIESYGLREFRLVHNMIAASRPWLLELCQLLIQENLGLRWLCDARVDCVDEELVELLAAAGCSRIFFGIETGSPRLQRLIRKNLAVAKVLPTAHLVADRGVEFNASFIVGFPQETLADLEQTLNLRTALKFVGGRRYHDVQLHLLAPYQGSRLFKEYGDQLGLDRYYSDMAQISPAPLAEEEKTLIQAHPDIFSAFYHYPTQGLPRDILVRVPYLFKNLDNLIYTSFLLWKDRSLGFPRTLLTSPLLLGLPGEQGHQGIGDLPNLRRVCAFAESVIRELGFHRHPLVEVMKYDLALIEIMRSEAVTVQKVEHFSYDILSLVQNIKASGFTRLPAEIEEVEHLVCFYQKNGQVAISRISSFTSFLSPLFAHLAAEELIKEEDTP
jgi:radical SAM superfamily enzyme YgiQ (UPF0313 family)